MDYATVIDQAVKQFYAEGNNDVHAWLLRVQASPEAWTFVWELLDPSKVYEIFFFLCKYKYLVKNNNSDFYQSREAQFYAATTLHAKISKQWEEVPKSEYPALQERLINFMKQPNMPKVVLSKLCHAVIFYLNLFNLI